MSLSQCKIISRLLNLAEHSKLNTKYAAAICSGNKMLCSAVNDNRSKFGNNIYCCGHSEANAVLKYVQSSFRGKGKQQLVLAG